MDEDGVDAERLPAHDPEVARTRRMVEDPLTYAIIGAAQKVHRTLGPGFRESTYQQALAKELMGAEITFVSQPEYEVTYEGLLCGTYKPDMVVREEVIVELKAIAKLASDHVAQTISYLKASGLPTGLLLNFGRASLEWRRLKNDKKDQSV